MGIAFLLRRARTSWLLLACVAVTVLLTTGLAALLWSFASGVVPAGALTTLASPQSRLITLNGLGNGTQIASESRLITSTLAKAWPGVGFQTQRALWSEPIQLSSYAVTAVAPGIPDTYTATQIDIASLDGFESQATLTAGTWPAAPRRGQPVPVALAASVASQLHLTVGSVVTGLPEPTGAAISLRVTGLFRPDDPTSTYWELDLLPASGSNAARSNSTIGRTPVSSSVINYGPAVVNPAAFAGTLTVNKASWLVLPTAAGLADGNLSALATNTSAADAQLTTVLPYGLQVTSSLPQLLDGLVSTGVLTQSLFTIAALLLLLVAGAALVLAARLLAGLREEESALLRARGATRWQLARPALIEAVILGAVPGLVGVLAGSHLTGAFASAANLRLYGYASRGVTALAWWWALATLVVCVVIMVWPALHTMTPGMARARSARQARLAGIAGAGGDLALVALAAVAVWQLSGYSAVARTASGSLGIDPVIAVAPALALAGMALIPLRGLPLLARLADKATDRERKLAAAMVSWQIARRPIRQTGPALLVLIATATTTLAVAGYASWHQSAADQATFAVGADVQVDSGGALPPNTSEAIMTARGVTSATPASVASTGGGGQLIALNASRAAKTILIRPDLTSVPASTLWQRITPSQHPGIVLPGHPDRLEVVASLGVSPVSSAAGFSLSLKAWVQDATGATYAIPAAGSLPADGKRHSLAFTLTQSRQASYPLRLLGFTTTYLLPSYDTANPLWAPTITLTIASLAVAETASGPFGKPFSDGAAVAGWRDLASSPSVPMGPPSLSGTTPPSDGTPPSVTSWKQAPGGAARLTFYAGHEPSRQILDQFNNGIGGGVGQVQIAVPPPSTVVPAIATTGYLTANHLGVGSLITADGITARIVASVAAFPTVPQQGGALITDLTEVNDDLVALASTSVPVTRWWLDTTEGQVPRLPAGLGLSVTSRAAQEATLIGDLLLTAPRKGMLAVGVAAVLLGVLGFSISVAASLRSRRTQSAVFAALGVGKNAQAGQLCLEQCAVSVPAAVVGVLAGVGLAELIVPAITLTADSTQPWPWALVIIPLGPVIALAFITAAIPVLAAALTVARRPDPAARLRAEAI